MHQLFQALENKILVSNDVRYHKASGDLLFGYYHMLPNDTDDDRVLVSVKHIKSIENEEGKLLRIEENFTHR